MSDSVAVWARPERGRRGPAPERSRDQIARAAIAIADADGLAAVSMREVAASLGTGPASLYRYVRAREDLLDLMADAVLAELELSAAPSTDWVDDLVALAGEVKAVHLRHPWLLDLPPQPSRLGPRAIDLIEHALGLMRHLPVQGRVKLEVIGVVNSLVAQFARHETAAEAPVSDRQAAQTAYLGKVAADGSHPLLAAALADTAPGDALDVFEPTIRHVAMGLTGIAHR
ncbi:regulatory protein, tetR family [Sinosporangium album]|uniref:Regulatory protein, tetR family n=1 Tax=Sinosporangium album TaxID=504805 RepID=A0A1G8KJ98_9ACTN|nr:TetR/AcrR family transcriptional regulator C-terminal domain-containing protein [Sinosporangium album]SDI43517.1 regulatory protein, tetR family [Sinosporangium album]